MIHETIYKKLLRIVPDLAEAKFEAKKLKAEGFMDLNIDILYWDEGHQRCVIALSLHGCQLRRWTAKKVLAVAHGLWNNPQFAE